MEGFKKCSKGHFYKEDKASCPYCPGNNSSVDIKTEVLSKTEASSENDSLAPEISLFDRSVSVILTIKLLSLV